MKRICNGKLPGVWVKIGPIQPVADFNPPRPKWCKRMRMRCPECGRKLWSSISINHDSDYLIHSLPLHKPKGWWKRRAQKITDRLTIRPRPEGR